MLILDHREIRRSDSSNQLYSRLCQDREVEVEPKQLMLGDVVWVYRVDEILKVSTGKVSV